MSFFALAHTLPSRACTPNEARMFEKPMSRFHSSKGVLLCEERFKAAFQDYSH